MALTVIDKQVTYDVDFGVTVPFMSPAAGASVAIRKANGGVLAQLYSASTGGTLLNNPFTLGADARILCYVESGKYDLEVTLAGETVTYSDFQAVDDIVIEGPKGTLQFADVASMKAGSAFNQQASKLNFANYLGQKVSVSVNNTISNKGGKDYIITNVDPGNLSTLVGGIWVGANHDLGGGYYAQLSGDRGYTLASFGGSGGANIDSDALQSLMTFCNTFGTATLDDHRSIAVKTATRVGDVNFDHVNIYGNDNVLKAAEGASNVLIHEASGDWDYCEISSLKLDGNDRASNGLTFLNPFGGRVQFNKFRALNCDVAILKREGNIGNTYYDLSISYCNYGMYCTSVGSPILMHSGADMFYHGHFSNCSNAAIYIDSPDQGTGQFVLDGTIFEYNQGFGIFIENFLGAGNPLELRNVWFEGNHTSTTVDVAGSTYTPRDLYLRNVSQGKIYGTVINSVEIISSDLIFEQCKSFGTQYFSILNSKVSFYRCAITAAMTATNSTVLSYDSSVGVGVITAADIKSAYVIRDGSLFYSTNPLVPSYNNTGIVDGGEYVESFDGNSPNLGLTLDFSGGKTYPVCLTKSASGTGRVDAYEFGVTSNELYYIKCEVRLNSDDIPTMLIQGTGGVISSDFSALLVKDKWVTLHLLGRATNNGSVNFWCTADGGSISLSFGACTVVRVTNVQRINDFFNSGQHLAKNSFVQCISSVIPSTAINMSAGDYCKKSSPTVDANNMMLDGWLYDGSAWQPQYISNTSPAA